MSRSSSSSLPDPWLGPLMGFVALLAAGRGLMSVGWLPASGAGFGDTEAYYTSWSADLMLGYHDHPGLIAWLLAAPTGLGAGVAGHRLVPLALFALTLALLTLYWRTVAGPRAALVGAMAFSAVPIYGTGALMIAPDAPLAAAWAGGMLAMELAKTRGPRWWWAVAACAAMAVASKWIGLAVVGALLLEAWRGSRQGRWTRTAAVVLGASLGALPSAAFELGHGLTGLRYHVLERHRGVPFEVDNWLRFVAGQLVVLSPILGAMLWRALTRPRSLDSGSPDSVRRAWRLSVAVLVPTTLMSLFTNEAEPHWPVLAYLPILGPMAAAMGSRHPRWLGAGIGLGLGLQVLLWIHLFTPVFVDLLPEDYDRRADLSGDLFGWSQVAAEARGALERGEVHRVAAAHYTECGQLAATLGLDDVVCLSTRRDAFDFLHGGRAGRAIAGEDLLFVRDNRYAERGPDLFECVSWDGEHRLDVRRGSRVVHWFGLNVCHGYLGPRIANE